MDIFNNNIKKLIIGLTSLVIIIVIYLIVKHYRKNNERPVYCTTPTLGKKLIKFPSTFIKPLSGVDQFSYHFFIYINDYHYRYGELKEVFSKGDSEYACPSFFLDKKLNNGIIKIMTGKGLNTFKLNNIDIKRWIHIGICVKNIEVDIYYQGKLSQTAILDDLAKINSEELFIGRNAGFNGLIYNLTYSPLFLSAKQIAKLAKTIPSTNEKYFKDF